MKVMLQDGELMLIRNMYEGGEVKNNFELFVCGQAWQ